MPVRSTTEEATTKPNLESDIPTDDEFVDRTAERRPVSLSDLIRCRPYVKASARRANRTFNVIFEVLTALEGSQVVKEVRHIPWISDVRACLGELDYSDYSATKTAVFYQWKHGQGWIFVKIGGDLNQASFDLPGDDYIWMREIELDSKASEE